MEGEIVNRVAKSALVTLDLESLYPEGERYVIDLSQWLEEGLLLREKDFRNALKEHDWKAYKDGYVSIYCSTEAIVPAWAYMLTGAYLEGTARRVVVGPPDVMETLLFQEVLESLDLEPYRDRPVIIKGCSKLPVPLSAYVWALQGIQKIAKSVMYGEACSAVPLFKNK
jgi:hypothetical protein